MGVLLTETIDDIAEICGVNQRGLMASFIRRLTTGAHRVFKRAARPSRKSAITPGPVTQADIDRLPPGWEHRSQSTRAMIKRVCKV